MLFCEPCKMRGSWKAVGLLGRPLVYVDVYITVYRFIIEGPATRKNCLRDFRDFKDFKGSIR